MEIKIGSHVVGDQHPTYFIADIAANHDGDLERAKLLIRLAKAGRGGRGQIPEFPRAGDRLGLRFQITGRAAVAPGHLEEKRLRGVPGRLHPV